ncbi:hypothetical protein BRARA_K00637 [Brassica rapa]|uniref:Uncharacterized protein n=1 Tax=Brassica campestris TaxID=3711 RepID=A0A397KXA8_BRACM|nr:hypothetical protein BRARA_K00637 [Brassica rapa]
MYRKFEVNQDRNRCKLREQVRDQEQEELPILSCGVATHLDVFTRFDIAEAVWTNLTRGLLGTHFSTNWDSILSLLISNTLDCRVRFLLRVVFQTSLHSLWRKRNERRHGSTPTPTASLVKFIDRQVKNKCLSISGNQRLGALLQLWFASQA